MMKGHFVNANCVRNTLIDALAVGWRFDLRKLLESRRTYLRMSAQGSCTARIGGTIVCADLLAEVAEPKQSRPSEGFVHFNLTFFTPVSVSDTAVRPQEYINEIRSLLNDSILQSGSIDLESLCIVSGEKVWKINVNLTVLNSEGNVLDCASLAAVSGLANLSLPASSVEGRCVRIWDAYEKSPVPLVMNHFPIFTTFCLYHDGKTVLIDPSEAEERLAESKLFIAMNARHEVCAMKSTAKKGISPGELHNCILIAENHVKELTKMVSDNLASIKAKKTQLSDSDLSTFNEIFDAKFDVSWAKLIHTPKEKSNLSDTSNQWGTEMVEGDFDNIDSHSDDETPSEKNVNDSKDESVTVEYSEFGPGQNVDKNAEVNETTPKKKLRYNEKL